MCKILVTKPVPPFCDGSGVPLNLRTGVFNHVQDIYARNIQKKGYGVICANKCILCPSPGFMAANGRDDCEGCLCVLKGFEGNRTLEEFL